MKFFLYGQELKTGAFHLIEAVVDVTTKCLTANFKSETTETTGEFAVVFRGALVGAVEPM